MVVKQGLPVLALGLAEALSLEKIKTVSLNSTLIFSHGGGRGLDEMTSEVPSHSVHQCQGLFSAPIAL